MDSGRALKAARRRAGLTQRELAAAAGVPQPVIARIESGRVRPRVDTLDGLLRSCGHALEARPLRGKGVDRSLVAEMLALSPIERVRRANREAESITELLSAVR